LKDSREKAQVAKFRQEMQQFILALEMYKSDNGMYPADSSDGSYPLRTSIYTYGRDTSNGDTGTLASPTTAITTAKKLTDPTILGNYISSTPQMINPRSTNIKSAYTYVLNPPEGAITNYSRRYRCLGDTSIPEYVIYIYNQSGIHNPLMYEAFPNWPIAEYNKGDNNGTFWWPMTYTRCFSLK